MTNPEGSIDDPYWIQRDGVRAWGVARRSATTQVRSLREIASEYGVDLESTNANEVWDAVRREAAARGDSEMEMALETAYGAWVVGDLARGVDGECPPPVWLLNLEVSRKANNSLQEYLIEMDGVARPLGEWMKAIRWMRWQFTSDSEYLQQVNYTLRQYLWAYRSFLLSADFGGTSSTKEEADVLHSLRLPPLSAAEEADVIAAVPETVPAGGWFGGPSQAAIDAAAAATAKDRSAALHTARLGKRASLLKNPVSAFRIVRETHTSPEIARLVSLLPRSTLAPWMTGGPVPRWDVGEAVGNLFLQLDDVAKAEALGRMKIKDEEMQRAMDAAGDFETFFASGGADLARSAVWIVFSPIVRFLATHFCSGVNAPGYESVRAFLNAGVGDELVHNVLADLVAYCGFVVDPAVAAIIPTMRFDQIVTLFGGPSSVIGGFLCAIANIAQRKGYTLRLFLRAMPGTGNVGDGDGNVGGDTEDLVEILEAAYMRVWISHGVAVQMADAIERAIASGVTGIPSTLPIDPRTDELRRIFTIPNELEPLIQWKDLVKTSETVKAIMQNDGLNFRKTRPVFIRSAADYVNFLAFGTRWVPPPLPRGAASANQPENDHFFFPVLSDVTASAAQEPQYWTLKMDWKVIAKLRAYLKREFFVVWTAFAKCAVEVEFADTLVVSAAAAPPAPPPSFLAAPPSAFSSSWGLAPSPDSASSPSAMDAVAIVDSAAAIGGSAGGSASKKAQIAQRRAELQRRFSAAASAAAAAAGAYDSFRLAFTAWSADAAIVAYQANVSALVAEAAETRRKAEALAEAAVASARKTAHAQCFSDLIAHFSNQSASSFASGNKRQRLVVAPPPPRPPRAAAAAAVAAAAPALPPRPARFTGSGPSGTRAALARARTGLAAALGMAGGAAHLRGGDGNGDGRITSGEILKTGFVEPTVRAIETVGDTAAKGVAASLLMAACTAGMLASSVIATGVEGFMPSQMDDGDGAAAPPAAVPAVVPAVPVVPSPPPPTAPLQHAVMMNTGTISFMTLEELELAQTSSPLKTIETKDGPMTMEVAPVLVFASGLSATASRGVGALLSAYLTPEASEARRKAIASTNDETRKKEQTKYETVRGKVETFLREAGGSAVVDSPEFEEKLQTALAAIAKTRAEAAAAVAAAAAAAAAVPASKSGGKKSSSKKAKGGGG